ncbi:hypothetical protein PHSY_005642 [Pseudozyma hubeiensis SY62]|uniref:Uncharacterized protein n=1 Tax=Pseudozyma hubeiensis (strain SY62) TaxID=1305764 RepID=R9P9M7_PSEHS|nr:hypothetical protein PHSY_005642 [Pseudozyma hubeiensis SY62]GAC98054.1 hypothetical protein PHSY_005642 [Pseudozyma hubeiensis SY62]
MKEQNTSLSPQEADQDASQQVTASTSSPTLSSSTSARHSRIRQATSESSMSINFARPILLRPDSVDPDDHQHGRDFSAVSALSDHDSAMTGEDSEWTDEIPTSPQDRRAMNFSVQSDASDRSTPLKIRRRGTINDKKLTINVTSSSSSSSRSASARRKASGSMVPPSEVSPSSAAVAPPPPAIRRASSLSNKLGKGKSPTESLAPPASAGIRFAPFTPTKPSPLADHNRSPVASSGSPSSASAAPSSGSSDKPLLSVPRYGFNPDFQLGQSSSPRSTKSKTSPTKPSPTYNGVSQGGVKSMLYSNARIPATPLSPRAFGSVSSPRSNEASNSPRTPRSPHNPGSPRTPRTPLTARLPLTPGLASRSSAAYRGVLLTTVTRAGSNERLPTSMLAPNAAERRTRNRSASIATEIRGFVRGGASEVIPRLELRVLERPRRESQLYNLASNPTASSKRHSLAAAQPSILKEKSDFAAQDVQDDSSPRAREFSRSVALDKLTSKRTSVSVGPRGSIPRHSSNFGRLSFVGHDVYRRERRQTGASAASGRSRRSDRSANSIRSALSRRTSMPTTASIKSSRPSLVTRRMSLAPSSFRGPRDEAMQPDDDESEDENDVVNEMHSRVTNIQEAKRWILGHRPSQDANAPAIVGRDIQDDQRPMTAMRRPTYAASVFQQARLMEAERQAGAALISSSVLNVNASASNVNAPMTPFPQTPGFPKTPQTAFPDGAVEGEEPYPRPETAAAMLPEPTWQQKTAHCLTAPWRFVKKQISPKYVLTMMDPREILFPITIRKIALWIVYGGVIAMLVLLDRYYHWWAKLDHAVHGKNFAIMGVLYGFEPTMILIIMLVARVPDARVVPDRTVLVPRARDSTEVLSDDDEESSHSSDEESVASADMATQMHSTILEEEHDEEDYGEHETQDQESGIVDIYSKRNSKRLSGLRAPMRRRSTHHTLASSRSAERRGSDTTNFSAGLQVPRTPSFDPRNRRSTIILHEPLTIDSLHADLARLETRRPSAASHQLVLAQTASRDSRRSSYMSIFAAAAGARPGEATPDPAVAANADELASEKSHNVAAQSDSTGELDEKKDVDAIASDKSDDVRIAMDSITHPSLTESTALIIPCHNADVEVLKAVLFAALVHFEPWQIFVIDNGNTPQPPTDMESSIRSQPMFARVNYIWLPIGNKNIAQFVGAKAAAVLNLDYVLTIDDDVIIPANFAAPMHIISETTTAVCYPITAVDHKGDRPVFVGWQDIEYKLSALAKMAESKMCGVLFPHGAASFWNRNTMIAVLRRHDLIYFADDVKMGLELQAIGERMGIDASISFETVAPETFLGPPTAGTPNYYNQRVRSWEMARHTLYWQFSKRFLFSLNGARTPVAIGWQKFTQFYNSTTNFIDWIRLPMFILLGGSGQFWLKSFAFILFLPIVPILLYRFVKTRNRPDLHPHLIDMLTYGIYKLMYSVVCVFGGIRSMLVFFPNHGHKPTLAEMEKAKDPRCIWLRDDFMKNSGGQGDLRDEPQQILLDDVAVAAEGEEAGLEEAQVVAVLPSVTVTPQGEDQPAVAVLNLARGPSRVTPIDEQLPTVFEAR